MYTNLPRRERRAIKTTLVLAWLFVSASGVSAILVSPVTIVAELGRFIVYGWGITVTVASIVAALGVLTRRYRWEWFGAWFAAAGIVPYSGTLWWLVSQGESTRFTQAFAMTGLLLFCIHRAISCAAHASLMRIAHEDVPRGRG